MEGFARKVAEGRDASRARVVWRLEVAPGVGSRNDGRGVGGAGNLFVKTR